MISTTYLNKGDPLNKTAVWDVETGRQLHELQTSPADARYCSLFPPAFSPDGKLLAYVLWQPPPAIQFVDTRTWRPLRKLEMELAEDLSANPSSLKQLRYLSIYDTKVTRRGAAELQRALPGCQVAFVRSVEP
ncbi:MAG TPA: hypothetical protein VF278_05875 [Pirellulales bacterium]